MATIANSKKKGGSWAFNFHDIFDGEAQIFQTKASNGVWQFRTFIKDEGQYVRKSLRTKDKDSAIERAKKLFFEIQANLNSGKKIFSITLYELIDGYIEFRLKHVDSGYITAGRLQTIKSQLKHFLDLKGGKTNLNELDKKCAFDYQYYRRSIGAKDVTIRNEQATINAVFKWGYQEGLINIPKLEFDVIKIIEAGKRGTFTSDEYNRLTKISKEWANTDNDLEEPHIKKERILIRNLILILTNTMIRIGEARQLKWKDVVSVNYNNNQDQDKGFQKVNIVIPAKISKTRKSRDIVTRGGQYFERVKRSSRYTNPDDYVFSEILENKMFSKDKLYSYWKELMELIGIDYKKRNITYYSLRHRGITYRLDSGVNIWDIAKISGTSVYHIEKHYGHSSHEMMIKAANNRFMDDLGDQFDGIDGKTSMELVREIEELAGKDLVSLELVDKGALSKILETLKDKKLSQ